MIRYAMAAVCAAALAIGTAEAGKFNKKINIGDNCPNFTGLECATSGKSASLADFKDKDAIVIAITCNHCPMAVAYEDRLIAFAKKHCGTDSKVALIAINVNNGEADRIDKMKERCKEKGFNFAYLYDPSQKIARDLGATRTPEFFVFDKNRKLVYTGAFDDGKAKAENATKQYVETAVLAALKGQAASETETAPVGCGIQFDKKK